VDRFETAWWARLADGGLRRVWVWKFDNGFRCLREEYSGEQEAARRRLSRLDYQRGPDGRPTEGELLLDARLVADVRCHALTTTDVAKAFDFLGSDDAARHALLSADASLDSRLPLPSLSSLGAGPAKLDD
jgi:hypothetical protein